MVAVKPKNQADTGEPEYICIPPPLAPASTRKLLLFHLHGCLLEKLHSSGFIWQLRALSMFIVLSAVYLLKIVNSNCLTLQFPEQILLVAANRGWPKYLKGKTEESNIHKGLWKTLQQSGNIQGYAHMWSCVNCAEDLTRP